MEVNETSLLTQLWKNTFKQDSDLLCSMVLYVTVQDIKLRNISLYTTFPSCFGKLSNINHHECSLSNSVFTRSFYSLRYVEFLNIKLLFSNTPEF